MLFVGCDTFHIGICSELDFHIYYLFVGYDRILSIKLRI
jgi:hypothetical protein